MSIKREATRLPQHMQCGLLLAVALILAAFAGAHSTRAASEKITNNVAVFAALDKVSANILLLEIPIDSTEQFGALEITPRACFTRPPTEPPYTTAFVEVKEIKLDNSKANLFAGWMFAESPGIHGVEHPVFDVWLTSCKTL